MKLDRRHFLHSSLVATLGSPLLADGPKIANPYLVGNFGPVREEVTADDLKVVGELPKDLLGLYVRNGPNPQFNPVGPHHWFEGDGMLHGVHLRDGKASYRNRYIQSEGWKKEKEAGKPVYKSMLEMPDMKAILAGKNPFKNAGNTALVRHAGKCLALYEAGLPHEIKLPGLETVGEFDYAGKLKSALTAHPKIDPDTGEMLGFAYTTQNRAVYYHFTKAGDLDQSVVVPLEKPVMMHDFAITRKYAIFFDLPQVFDLPRAFTGKSPWYFDDQKPARFGLLSRKDPKQPVRWFEAKTCYMFHSLNAYDDGDAVVLVGCRYPRFPGSLELNANNKPLDAAGPKLHRWRFDLATGKTLEEGIDDVNGEMPRINETHTGKPMRYGYTAAGDGEFATELRKYDFEKKTAEGHPIGDGRFAGEAVFVARADAKAEDDGYLLTYVFDRKENKSELLVVDARDIKAKPLARVLLPVRVPYGFHGMWVPQGDLG